jgi:hypothetical protein
MESCESPPFTNNGGSGLTQIAKQLPNKAARDQCDPNEGFSQNQELTASSQPSPASQAGNGARSAAADASIKI